MRWLKLVGRLGDEPRGGDEGVMSVAEGEEGVRADDDYAKGEVATHGGARRMHCVKPKHLSAAHAAHGTVFVAGCCLHAILCLYGCDLNTQP